MERLMQLSVDISLDNLLLLISKMDINQIEEVKNKIVEQKLYFQTFQKDDIENIVDDFRKEEYSNDFLLDLEAGLRKSSVYGN
jgi:threonyl-tRNA synthetase